LNLPDKLGYVGRDADSTSELEAAHEKVRLHLLLDLILQLHKVPKRETVKTHVLKELAIAKVRVLSAIVRDRYEPIDDIPCANHLRYIIP
jgi:hypothetical protein